MKRWIHATTDNRLVAGCSFDFDLGDDYDPSYIETAIGDILSELGATDYLGIDFRSVEYPGGKVYSQCGFDYVWSGAADDYEGAAMFQAALERKIQEFIEDEGGNFLGLECYSIED